MNDLNPIAHGLSGDLGLLDALFGGRENAGSRAPVEGAPAFGELFARLVAAGSDGETVPAERPLPSTSTVLPEPLEVLLLSQPGTAGFERLVQLLSGLVALGPEKGADLLVQASGGRVHRPEVEAFLVRLAQLLGPREGPGVSTPPIPPAPPAALPGGASFTVPVPTSSGEGEGGDLAPGMQPPVRLTPPGQAPFSTVSPVERAAFGGLSVSPRPGAPEPSGVPLNAVGEPSIFESSRPLGDISRPPASEASVREALFNLLARSNAGKVALEVLSAALGAFPPPAAPSRGGEVFSPLPPASSVELEGARRAVETLQGRLSLSRAISVEGSRIAPAPPGSLGNIPPPAPPAASASASPSSAPPPPAAPPAPDPSLPAPASTGGELGRQAASVFGPGRAAPAAPAAVEGPPPVSEPPLSVPAAPSAPPAGAPGPKPQAAAPAPVPPPQSTAQAPSTPQAPPAPQGPSTPSSLPAPAAVSKASQAPTPAQVSIPSASPAPGASVPTPTASPIPPTPVSQAAAVPTSSEGSAPAAPQGSSAPPFLLASAVASTAPRTTPSIPAFVPPAQSPAPGASAAVPSAPVAVSASPPPPAPAASSVPSSSPAPAFAPSPALAAPAPVPPPPAPPASSAALQAAASATPEGNRQGAPLAAEGAKPAVPLPGAAPASSAPPPGSLQAPFAPEAVAPAASFTSTGNSSSQGRTSSDPAPAPTLPPPSPPAASQVQPPPQDPVFKTAPPPPSSSDPAETVRQLAAHLRREAGTLALGARLSFQLVPETLGRVTIQVALVDQTVTARFVVASPEAREQLQPHLVELRTALNQAGLQVDQLQVQVQGGGSSLLTQYYEFQQEYLGPRFAPSAGGREVQALPPVGEIEPAPVAGRRTLVDVFV